MSKKYELTPSLENYLESIYFLQLKNGEVRITDIAYDLKVSKPSVNRAINTLKDANLVKHEHYGVLTLTEEGKRIAKDVAGRHELLKRFLTEVLKIDEETAEKEACAMEHVVSSDTLEKLENFLKEFL